MFLHCQRATRVESFGVQVIIQSTVHTDAVCLAFFPTRLVALVRSGGKHRANQCLRSNLPRPSSARRGKYIGRHKVTSPRSHLVPEILARLARWTTSQDSSFAWVCALRAQYNCTLLGWAMWSVLERLESSNLYMCRNSVKSRSDENRDLILVSRYKNPFFF